MMVLLNDAWMCAMPSATFFLTFLRTRAPTFGFCGAVAILRCPSALLGRRRRLAHARARLLRALAGPGVGTRSLAANRQAAAMPNAAVAAEIHQPLDAHRHLAAQVAFDGELADVLAQLVHLRVGQVLDLGAGHDARGDADRLGARTADAVDRRQSDLGMLMIRNVYACNTGHDLPVVCRYRR